MPKKNDWLASLYFNPDLSLTDFENSGITPENTAFRTRDEYKNMPQIVDAFKTPDGDFDEKKFNTFYDYAAQLYSNYATNQYVKKAPELYGYLDTQWDAPLTANYADTAPRISKNEVESEQSVSLSRINKAGKSLYQNKTIKEIAESQEVVDPITGEGLGWTPEDKGGLFKGLTRPTIVLATWDEDGTHMENGVEVQHLKGDIKYNANGKPYAELLGDRDPSNKTVFAYSDTITRETSRWNKYDFFDSDDLDKSLVGTVAKTVVTMLPYFIPGVQEVWGGITALEALGRVLPVLGKAVNGIWTNDSNNEFAKTMNEWQGALMRFDPTVSQHSQEHLVTFENFGNLVGSISGQLFQQKMIAAIPTLLNGMKQTERAGKLGRELSLTYMALTSGQDSYDTFKEAGASDRVAGYGFLANILALRGLLGIDYFRNNLLKNTYMDESGIRAPLLKAVEEISPKLIAEGEQAVTRESAQKFIDKVSKFYQTKLLNGLTKSELFNRMLAEGTEEVMEEGLLDLTKIGAKITEAFGADLTGQNGTLDFQTDMQDIVQRYGMSFFGGLIGGGIFVGQERYADWINGTSRNSLNEEPFKKMVYLIGEGKADDMRSLLDKWHRRGILGSKELTSKFSTIQSLDGITPVMETVNSSNQVSQNDAVYNGMKNFIDTIEQIVKAEGLMTDATNLLNIRKLGFQESDGTLKADVIANLGELSNFMNDYEALANDIVLANGALKEAIKNVTVPGDTVEARKQTEEAINNSSEIAEIRSRLETLRQKKQDFMNGKYNWQYATQALFIANDNLQKKYLDISIENFARIKYGMEFNSLTDEQKTNIADEFDSYKKKTGKYQILQAAEVYRALAARLKPRLDVLFEQLKSYTVDPNHKIDNIGQTTRNDLIEEYNRIFNKIKSLKNKEALTPEGEGELTDLSRKLIDVESQIRALNANTNRLLVSSPEGTEFSDITTILGKPNITPEELSTLVTSLENMYRSYAESKNILSGDTELQALYNWIRRNYLATPVIQRISQYMINKFDSYVTDDPEYSSEWTNLANETSTDEAVWFNDDRYEPTTFQQHIAELLTQLVDNIGIDNTAATKIEKQIRQEFKDHTNVQDSDVDEMFKSVLPNIAGKDLLTLIRDFDNLRRNVTYVPLNDLLNDFFFEYSGRRSSILDLVRDEERKFADSVNLTDYLITNPQVLEDLKTANKLLDAIGGVLIGSTDKTNASINAFEGNPEELPVLDENTFKILGTQFDILSNRIKFLIDVSENNANKLLTEHEDIDKNMRSKFIKYLISPAFSEQFKNIFKYTDADGTEHEIDPSAIWAEIAPSDLDWDTIDSIDLAKLQKADADFHQALNDEMQKLSYFDDDSVMAEKLVSLFGKNLYLEENTILGKDGSEIITNYSALNHILSIICVPANKFYTKYRTVLSQDSFKFAPVYSQELSILQGLASIARPKLFNTVLDEITKPVNMSIPSNTDKERLAYIQHKSVLRDMYIIPGSAGSGKSTGVVGTITTLLSDHPSHQFIVLAPNYTLADNLSTITGEDTKSFNKKDFFKEIVGDDLGDYEQDEYGHIKLMHPITGFKSDLFDTNKKLKILFVDEITLFTEAELDILSRWASENNIQIIGLGDPKQNAANAITKIPDSTRTISNTTGIEDCFYMGAPMLTASLRAINDAQLTNFKTIDSRLAKVYNESTRHAAWNAKDYDDALGSEPINIEFYEGPKTILGTKLVNNVNIIDEARKYKDLGSVAIIYDGDKYDSLSEPGIKKVKHSDMQGQEFDYVFVDVDWNAHSRVSAMFVSKYNMLRDFYTVTQRATTGSIILDNGIKEQLKIIQSGSNPKLNSEFRISDEQKVNFKNNRISQLTDIVEDSDFNSIFIESESVVKPVIVEKPVEPTPVTPVAETPAPVKPEVTKVIESVPEPAKTPAKPTPTPEPIPTLSSVGTIFANNEDYVQFMETRFKEFDRENPNSLRNTFKRVNPQFNFGDNYQRIITAVCSYIRNNADVSTEIKDDLQFLTYEPKIKRELLSFFKEKPVLQIKPYLAGKSIMLAVFTNGSESFEIPVTILKTTRTGTYTGTFTKTSDCEIGDNAVHQSMAQFKQNNPGVFVSDGAVLAINSERERNIKSSDLYNSATKDMFFGTATKSRNVSKVGVVLTDEHIVAKKTFTKNLFEPENGNAIKNYHRNSVMFLQRRTNSLSDIMRYVAAMAYIKNPEHLTVRNQSEYTSNPYYEDPIEIVKSLMDLDVKMIPGRGVDKYKTISQRFQILHSDTARRLTNALFDLASKDADFDAIYTNASRFIGSVGYTNANGNLDKPIMIFGADNKYIVLEANFGEDINGWNVYSYNPNTYELTLTNTIPYNNARFDFKNLLQNEFGKQNVNVQLAFRTYSQDGSWRINSMDVNDQLYFLFKNGRFNESAINTKLLTYEVDGKRPYKYGIYLNVVGTKLFSDDSVWMGVDGDLNDFVTDIGNVKYSQYTIDESLIVGSTPERAIDLTPINDLRSLVSSLNVDSLFDDYITRFSAGESIESIKSELNEVLLHRNPETWEKWTITDDNKLRKINAYDVWIKQLTGDNSAKLYNESFLKTWNYGIYFVTLQDGTQQAKLVRKNGDDWTTSEFKTFEKFKLLLDLVNDPRYSPLKSYVNSLVFDYSPAYNAIAEQADAWLQANIADVDDIYNQINDYLLERLENDEC